MTVDLTGVDVEISLEYRGGCGGARGQRRVCGHVLSGCSVAVAIASWRNYKETRTAF